MNINLVIRKAVVSDINDILQIEHASFQVDCFSKGQFKYLLSHAIFYVAENNKKILGYYILLTKRRSKKVRLYSIAVHPNARGKNVGQVLMYHLLNIAKEMHYPCVSLEVRENNSQAIQLYKKFGFVENGIKTNYYIDGANALIMHCYLNEKD
ncbi:MAG: ribosomal protein S18-alanine N-acetyltransferase [Bacteroidales bacterium]|nr:ribosomal protein S18-alanine N-acetyltransferase [Bacteroidales bacterium]MDD4208748.1 ribosomal protein S18-alanine N-acetyltransferase [Bacteroidales bacterium]